MSNEAEVPPQPCRHLHATNYDPAKVVYGQPITVLENGQGWCLDCKTSFMPDEVVRYVPASALESFRLRAIEAMQVLPHLTCESTAIELLQSLPATSEQGETTSE